MADSLDEAAVRRVAHLARLSVSDDEVARFTRQLSIILKYFTQLEEVDTTDAEPTGHPLAVENVYRDDDVRGTLPAEAALRNAPRQKDHLFQVPQVLDTESA